MKNMGSFGGLLKLIPGMKISDSQLQEAERQLKRVEAMINSMTKEERRDPDLVARSPSRKQRIAKGSGYQTQDVTKLVSDFQRMRSLMQQMGQGRMPNMFGMPSMPPLKVIPQPREPPSTARKRRRKRVLENSSWQAS